MSINSPIYSKSGDHLRTRYEGGVYIVEHSSTMANNRTRLKRAGVRFEKGVGWIFNEKQARDFYVTIWLRVVIKGHCWSDSVVLWLPEYLIQDSLNHHHGFVAWHCPFCGADIVCRIIGVIGPIPKTSALQLDVSSGTLHVFNVPDDMRIDE